MTQVFTGNFTQQEPIPEDGIEAAIAVMRHGRLHRYNVVDGEQSETALLEREFADYVGAKYCLAVASGGYALGAALKALQVQPGDPVLTNGFTLAPVPGAIAGMGARPVFVETTDQLLMDLDDLTVKINRSGAKVLMLSHMRGHIVDMDRLMQICDDLGVAVIEDCAHTMGATWDGVQSGRHGVIACYSTQTFKHVNSGEGGLLITDDDHLMARATMLSGSYMLFDRHLAGAPSEAFADIRLDTPNCSGRMDNLRAAILRPQLRNLDAQIAAWAARVDVVTDVLRGVDGLQLVETLPKAVRVGSSYQFLVPTFTPDQMVALVDLCADHGVQLKWFGADAPAGYTSRHDSWRYAEAQSMPATDRVLAGLIDLRLPLTFTLDDCRLVAQIIRQDVRTIHHAR